MKPSSIYLETVGDNVVRVQADLDHRPPGNPCVTFRIYGPQGASEFSLPMIEFATLCAEREMLEREGAALKASLGRSAS